MGRGWAPKSADDPDPDGSRMRVISGSDWHEEFKKRCISAETETEKWLRTSEAWDAFTQVLIDRLEEYDPANGCRVGRATDARALSR
jgi:hypothetical protein